VLAIAIRWMGVSGENYRSIITSDGRGYYQYYDATLGNQSLDHQKANGTYLVYTPDSAVVNKYFVGLPVLWSPFVLPVYAYYHITSNSEIDFYAEGFQKAISLAALFYLFLGLFALKKLLQTFDMEQKVINFSLFAFFFGTNLSYYTIIAPSMSHVYSFALISGFLLFIRKYSIKQFPQHLIYAALIFGLIVLVRPVNGLILLAIPIVWKERSPFFGLLKSQLELLVAAAFLVIMIVAIQPIFWYLQTGSLIQWSYAGEGFYFTHPRILDFLISFRKGVFIYAPLVFVSLFGLKMIYHNSRRRFWFGLSFLLVLFYVLSSWWNWYYGDSYGSRVMIDFYPLFIFLFAYLLQAAKAIARKIILAISVLLIVLNVFQSYQYYHNIMSHFDMNKEKYWYIFGKYGEEYENRLGGNDDIAPYHTKPMQQVLLIDKQKGFSLYRTSCVKSNGDNSIISANVDGQEFPCTITIPAEKLMKYKALFVEMDCIIRNEGEELGDVYWTISIRSEHNPSHYYAFRVNAVPIQKEGQRIEQYHFALPVPKSEKDEVLISLWNKGKKKFSIDMLQIEVLGIKE
jgi:hypothetical protein